MRHARGRCLAQACPYPPKGNNHPFSIHNFFGTGVPRPSRADLAQGAAAHPAGLLLTTYDQLRIHRDALLPVRWGVAVLDEGHKIRNPDAEVTLVCKQVRQRLGPSLNRQVCKHARRRLGLAGVSAGGGTFSVIVVGGCLSGDWIEQIVRRACM